MRIVIDTNIWISFLFGKVVSGLEKLINNDKIEIISSDEQIQEIFEVISRPKLRTLLNITDIRRLYHFFQLKVQKVQIKNDLRVCRDPKDDFIIETAIIGKADYLITGDKDLLILDPFQKLRIISYNDFEKMIKNK
jgi:hypothetical protein